MDNGFNPAEEPRGYSLGRASLALAGIGLIYGAVALFGFVCYLLVQDDTHASERATTLADFTPEMILTAIGLVGALLGTQLLRSVGLSRGQQPGRVINSEEWQAISEQVKSGQEEAVTQYIRLTSLSGFTGAFTKLGLTGLPLATIGLTLFFSILAISYPNFMDLAKLTLGAFIGSFVQKQAGAGGSVKLPGGQTVSVTAPPVA
ncbi:hypothetical protein FHS95_003164 [Sphingomonas naasensis]|uniref:Uncharacterized protein n=1 Tax=Sphingomonas naasensis TaxID=1344951 RepID=A0A4V3QW87_9SPHN|nr:hypothetical protein [Sphingomonas naasensis]NIJ21461.1 hypothetical protein [Sphingomonas naasensis]TGX41582.1 hypothetical protein E5A74_13290 [Sphingomonas naasensis]